MGTLRQIQANRMNALRSTGPRSVEGKERSRRNALKHGLAGDGVVLPEEEVQAIEERIGEWVACVEPRDAKERWLARLAAIETVKVDIAHQLDTFLRAAQAHRARNCWDDDRRTAAEDLMRSLPDAPALVARKLQQTAQGCDSLIERWEQLEQILVSEGRWTEAQLSTAYDMLGVPRALRSACTELGTVEAFQLDDRLAVVRGEIDLLLTRRAELLNDLDDHERAGAEVGLGPISPMTVLVRRYLAASMRRFRYASAEFDRHRAERQALAPYPPADDPASDDQAAEALSIAEAVPATPSAAALETEAELRTRLLDTLMRRASRMGLTLSAPHVGNGHDPAQAENLPASCEPGMPALEAQAPALDDVPCTPRPPAADMAPALEASEPTSEPEASEPRILATEPTLPEPQVRPHREADRLVPHLAPPPSTQGESLRDWLDTYQANRRERRAMRKLARRTAR